MATSMTTTQKSNNNAIIANVDQKRLGFDHDRVDRVAPPAKIKIGELEHRIFTHNLKGSYTISVENLNAKISSMREEIKEQEEIEAEKEAKFEEKVNDGGVNNLNQNLIFQRLLKTINRATTPERVMPILDNKKMAIVDLKTFEFTQSDKKPRPIYVASILKQVLYKIGEKPKAYTHQEEKTVKSEQQEEVVAVKKEEKDGKKTKDPEEIKKEREKKKQGLKWKKSFNIEQVELLQEAPKPIKSKKNVVTNDSKELSEGEIRRRRIIGETGSEIEKIEKLENTVGEDAQFYKALQNRKKKLVEILSGLGQIEVNEKEHIEITSPNTEFQDLIDEFMNVKEAPTKEQHDKKQEEYEQFYNDPFIIEQLNRQQLEGILYEYNQPEVYNKIQENERIANRTSVENSINNQQDTIKELNQNIINSREQVENREKEEKEKAQLMLDAKSEAMAMLLNNLTATAIEEVSNEFKKYLAEKAEEDAKIKREADAQALILDFNNWASMAFDEIVNAEKGRIANEKFEENLKQMSLAEANAFFIQNLAAEDFEKMQKSLEEEYNQLKAEYEQKINEKIKNEEALKRGAEAQAIILDFKNISAKALEEIVDSEKKRMEKEMFDSNLAKMADAEANAFLMQNLAATAHDEVIASATKEINKAQKEQEELKRAGREYGEIIFQKDLVAKGVEEVIENYKKDNKDIINKAKRKKAIKKGTDAVRERKAILDGRKEGKRLFEMDQKRKLLEGSKEEANNLFIKDIKYNAQLIAKKLVEGASETKEESAPEVKEEVKPEASNNDGKGYSVTDVNNRYLRVFKDSRRIQIDGPHYSNLETNSKGKYGNAPVMNDDGMIESLNGQLEALDLGDNQYEEGYSKAA